jgi:hypothetical protein
MGNIVDDYMEAGSGHVELFIVCIHEST